VTPRLLFVALAFLVLAAHFLRAGQIALLVLTLAMIAILAVPRPLAARAVQCALVLAACESEERGGSAPNYGFGPPRAIARTLAS
jgi:hypothetical protein